MNNAYSKRIVAALSLSLVWMSVPLLSAQTPSVAPTAPVSTPGSISSTSEHPLLIGIGDAVSVEVFDTPSLSFQDRVDEAGFLRSPVLGPISIAGLSTEQASRVFEEKLRSGNVMLSPSVTVQDVEYATQGIVVLGQVRTPGTFTLLGPHTLYDILSSAGGVTETAGPRITITRRGDPEHPEVIPVNSPNFSELQRTTRVYPGDTVFVAKADMFYVIGDVGRSGAYYMQNGRSLTVLNALALAGGDNDTAKSDRVSIVRSTAGSVMTIPVSVKDIKHSKAPDIAVLPEDIIVVPRSGLKVLLNTIIPGASLAVTSAVVTTALVH